MNDRQFADAVTQRLKTEGGLPEGIGLPGVVSVRLVPGVPVLLFQFQVLLKRYSDGDEFGLRSPALKPSELCEGCAAELARHIAKRAEEILA